MKFTIFGRPFLGHHYYILSLSDLWLGVEKKIFKEYKCNAFPLYELYGHVIAKEPLSWGHEIYNFGRPFVGHHYYTLKLSDPCPKVKKKIL